MMKRKQLLEQLYKDEVSMQLMRDYITYHDEHTTGAKIELFEPKADPADPLSRPEEKDEKMGGSDEPAAGAGGAGDGWSKSRKRKRATPTQKQKQGSKSARPKPNPSPKKRGKGQQHAPQPSNKLLQKMQQRQYQRRQQQNMRQQQQQQQRQQSRHRGFTPNPQQPFPGSGAARQPGKQQFAAPPGSQSAFSPSGDPFFVDSAGGAPGVL